MSEELLECVETGPSAAGAAVIWLHGLGADGWDFYPIVPELKLPHDLAVRFVFPHAPRRPVTLNAGMEMRAWYDIADLDLEGRSQDEAGIRRAAVWIESLIAREKARGVPAGRIVLAGFSQGGAMALFSGLRHAERLAGIVALSCYLLLPGALEAEAAPANRGLPVFMGHGTDDPIVPFAAGKAAEARLGELGHAVDFREYAMPHAVHPGEIADIGAFLARRLTVA